MEENKIEDAQIVQNTDLHINFTSTTENTVITIRDNNVKDLARVFYNLCLDNKIDATITTKNK